MVAEIGRQPWLINGLFKTAEGVTRTISSTEVWITLLGYFVLYSILTVTNFKLIARFARQGASDDIGHILKLPNAAAPEGGKE